MLPIAFTYFFFLLRRFVEKLRLKSFDSDRKRRVVSFVKTQVSLLNLDFYIPIKDVRKMILKYLTTLDIKMVFAAHNRSLESQISSDDEVCNQCASEGHIGLLIWAHQQGCKWDQDTCAAAASSGHLEVLQVLRGMSCTWDSTVYTLAASNGHLELLQWVHLNSCPLPEVNLLRYDLYALAARRGHLHVIVWLRSIDYYQWNELTASSAASGGHLNVLQWLVSNGCPVSNDLCAAAASSGKVEVLEWTVAQGFALSENTFLRAGNHIHILEWLHRHGCPWNAFLSARVADFGNLVAFKWLIDHGCPWDIHTCHAAARRGCLGVLFSELREGSPFVFQARNAVEQKWLEIFKRS